MKLLKLGIRTKELIALLKKNGYECAYIDYKYKDTKLKDIPEEEKKFI